MHCRADSATLGRSYTCVWIGNRTQRTETTSLTPTYYSANALNQYYRTLTDNSGASDVRQAYQFDDEGNLIEAYVPADMDCSAVIDEDDGIAYGTARTSLAQYQSEYPWCDYPNGDMNADGVLDSADDHLFADYLDGHDGASGLRQVYTWDAENRRAR
jgi:hypothetical protein